MNALVVPADGNGVAGETKLGSSARFLYPVVPEGTGMVPTGIQIVAKWMFDWVHTKSKFYFFNIHFVMVWNAVYKAG